MILWECSTGASAQVFFVGEFSCHRKLAIYFNNFLFVCTAGGYLGGSNFDYCYPCPPGKNLDNPIEINFRDAFRRHLFN